MADTFIPPEVAASAARRGLRLAVRVDGIDRAALKRAAAIAERKPHTLTEVGKLIAAHALSASKRPANVGTDASPTPWLVAWLLLGGAPGQEWAASVWRRNGSDGEAARMGLARWSAADVHHGVCVAVRLSPELAGQFPAVINFGGHGAPHVTVAYFKTDPTTPRDTLLAEVRTAVAAACGSLLTRPFALALPGGIGEFYTPPDEMARPIYSVVQSPGLLAFRAELFRALRGKPWADAARDAFGGYAPHATLDYMSKGQVYDGPQPRGQMTVDAVEVWVESHAYSYPITGEPEPVLSMARRGAALRLSREAPPPPAAMRIHNPDGLHLGRPFRVLTADEAVRDGATGEALGCFPVETLHEFVRVFEARCARGEGAPRIDYNHGPSRGMDPTLFGAVVGCYVADDGERGPGLYVVPGWTDHGREFVAQHATPDGGSLLSNSPEFAVGPAYARSGGAPDELGELLGGAELFGVALTGSPQQSEAIIDPVRLSRPGTLALAAEEVSGMDPEQVAAVGGIDERVGALEAVAAELGAKLDKVLAAVEASNAAKADMVAEVVEEAAGSVEEMLSTDGADMIAEAVDAAVAAADAEALALADAETQPEDIKAMSRKGHPKRAEALMRRLNALSRAKVAVERKAFAKRVAALEADSFASKCDAAMAQLRSIGMSAAEEPKARELWAAKFGPQAAQFARLFSVSAHPYDDFVTRLKANPTVPLGMNGVRADLQTGGAVTVADVRAWSIANGHDYDKDPTRAGAAWAKATGRSTKEITR